MDQLSSQGTPWPGPEEALAVVPEILSPVQAGSVLGSGPWEW